MTPKKSETQILGAEATPKKQETQILGAEATPKKQEPQILGVSPTPNKQRILNLRSSAPGFENPSYFRQSFDVHNDVIYFTEENA